MSNYIHNIRLWLAATHASVGLDYVETGANVTIQTITTDGVGGGAGFAYSVT